MALSLAVAVKVQSQRQPLVSIPQEVVDLQMKFPEYQQTSRQDLAWSTELVVALDCQPVAACYSGFRPAAVAVAAFAVVAAVGSFEAVADRERSVDWEEIALEVLDAAGSLVLAVGHRSSPAVDRIQGRSREQRRGYLGIHARRDLGSGAGSGIDSEAGHIQTGDVAEGMAAVALGIGLG